jgi:hypothetical protein
VSLLGGIVLLLRIWKKKDWMDMVLLLQILALLLLPLDFYATGVFILGVLLITVRNQDKWHWLDVVLLLWIPLLLLPSILSITFPNENPALNRTGGAIVPVAILIGIALENVFINIKSKLPKIWGKVVSWGMVLLIFVGSAISNAKLVFVDYYQFYKASAWNSSEIGHVIKQFSETVGDSDQAWVVPYLHWVDTRLVGIHAVGRVEDFAVWQWDIRSTAGISPPKLYIYKPEDQETFDILHKLYPDGINEIYHSEVFGRDFMLYYVLK